MTGEERRGIRNMGSATPRTEVSPEGIEFIRFCYGRRRTGWPEIYDEMCAVASRGLFRGWSHEDLAGHGIGFSIAGLPALAAVVRRTIEAEPVAQGLGLKGRRGIALATTSSPDASIEGAASSECADPEAPVVEPAATPELAVAVAAAPELLVPPPDLAIAAS